MRVVEVKLNGREAKRSSLITQKAASRNASQLQGGREKRGRGGAGGSAGCRGAAGLRGAALRRGGGARGVQARGRSEPKQLREKKPLYFSLQNVLCLHAELSEMTTCLQIDVLSLFMHRIYVVF